MTKEHERQEYGYTTRGRNGNAWCSVECKITATTQHSVLMWPSSLPDVERWVPRYVCEHGGSLKESNQVQDINIREWFKETLAMAKQRRGTFADSQNKQRTEYVTLHGDIIQCTEKAILFVSREEPDMESWIPKSQCEDGDELGEDDGVDLHVAKWFVEKEDLK